MKKVMIVDDEIIVRKGLISLFDWKSAGYDIVSECESGNEAIREIERVRPDIILTDLMMDDGDGFSVIEEVQKHYPDIRSVVLSSYNDFDNVRLAMKKGASDYIFKLTVKPEELIKTLDEVSKDIKERDKDEGKTPDDYSMIIKAIKDDGQSGCMDIPIQLDSQYRVIAMMIDNFALLKKKNIYLNWTRTMSLVEGICEEALKKNGELFLLRYSEEIRLIIMKTGKKELKDDMELLARRIRMLTSLKVSFSVSGISDKKENLRPRIREALDLLSGLYYSDDCFIEKKEECPDLIMPDEFSKEEYLKLLSTMNAYSALRLFKREIEYINGKRAYAKADVIRELCRSAGLLHVILSSEDMAEETLMKDGATLFDMIRMSDRWNFLLAQIVPFLSGIRKDLRKSRNIRAEIEDTLTYVYANIDKDITVRKAAERINMSESNFSHVFSEEMGISFLRFVIKAKMERSARLLVTTDLRINEIADKVGINNPNYFSVQFRKYYGISPASFRDEKRSQDDEGN